jgi:sucrose phosphorylase
MNFLHKAHWQKGCLILNPFGDFEFLDLDERLFVVDQISRDNKERILAIHNFSNEEVTVAVPENITSPLCDILSANCNQYECDDCKTRREITLEPYQMMWLKGEI